MRHVVAWIVLVIIGATLLVAHQHQPFEMRIDAQSPPERKA